MRMIRGWSSAAAAVVLLLSSACGAGVHDRSEPVGKIPDLPDSEPPREAWRWESAYGIEIGVPEDWSINDTGCRQTDAPSVVRARLVVHLCATPEPANKQIVEIIGDDYEADDLPPPGLTVRDVAIGSERAQRAEGKTQDGRAQGWLRIPRLEVVVHVRVLTDELLNQILDSVRVVDVDSHGCATAREHMKATPPAADTLVPEDTHSLAICVFGQRQVLMTSGLVEDDVSDRIVDLLNEAKPGPNRDVPADKCARSGRTPLPDILLVAHGKRDRALVEISFADCTDRKLSNGRDTAQVTQSLLRAVMDAVQSGFGFSDLPR